jgi:hypothetical protein
MWAESAIKLWPVDMALTEAILIPELKPAHKDHLRAQRKAIIMFLIEEMIKSLEQSAPQDISVEQSQTLFFLKDVRDEAKGRTLHVAFTEEEKAILEGGDDLGIEGDLYGFAWLQHQWRRSSLGLIEDVCNSSEEQPQNETSSSVDNLKTEPEYQYRYDSKVIFLGGSNEI